MRGGPHYWRFAQIIETGTIRVTKDTEHVVYTVITIDNEEQVTLHELKQYELRKADLSAMEVLALQADPDFRKRGKKGHDD